MFNILKYFHVCRPRLPPCLGHDLFEGVVAGDLALFIKHFVKQRYFSYEYLNRKIETFKYIASDASNKPNRIKANGERLEGHAVQNWCFLRLLSLFIGNRIKDLREDPVWEVCLKLREIVDLVCSPQISADQVTLLQFIIGEYLQSRKTLFPEQTPQPKHHYLVHYPELTIQFGPLIRLWTLQFESKHTYFKQCTKELHNFQKPLQNTCV